MIGRRSCIAGAAGLLGLSALPGIAEADAAAPPDMLVAGLGKYKGSTVRFLTERNAHQLALADQLAKLAGAAGIRFDVRYITTDEIEKMVVVDYMGGASTWDLVYTGGVQRMAQWAYGNIIKDIAPLMKTVGDPKILAWDDFTAPARTAPTIGDKVFGLVCATSEQALAYRRDLFGNKEEQAAFQKRFGYKLAPPQTYGQVQDIAAFFTRKPGDMLAGQKLSQDFYGTILADKRGTFLWHTYENLVAAFGVQVYDPKTRKVGLDSKANLDLVATMKSLAPFMPASNINMTSGEIAESFAHGGAAFIGEYFDRLLLVLSEKDAVGLGKVGFTFFPSVPGNPLGHKHGARSGPPVVSIYGRSRNADAAYKLLEAACSAPSQSAMAASRPAYLPSRSSVLKALAEKRPELEYLVRLSEAVAAGEVTTMNDRDILPYPAITKAAQIVDAVTTPLSEVLSGAPAEAKVKQMQASVEQLMAHT